MTQRVRIPHRGQSPSSATQLPILAALHAGSPTLFPLIIHEKEANVNTQFSKMPGGQREDINPVRALY